MNSNKKSEQVVLDFIKALNEEDFDSAQGLLNDSMTFEGPLGTRNGAEVYIADMRKMKFKYSIKQVFSSNDTVCLVYDIDMSVKSIPTCGLYQLEDGKISSLQVYFDPRPVLEGSRK